MERKELVEALKARKQEMFDLLSDLSLFLKYGSKRAFAFGIGRDFSAEGGAHQANEFVEMEPLTEFACIIGATLLRA